MKSHCYRCGESLSHDSRDEYVQCLFCGGTFRVEVNRLVNVETR